MVWQSVICHRTGLTLRGLTREERTQKRTHTNQHDSPICLLSLLCFVPFFSINGNLFLQKIEIYPSMLHISDITQNIPLYAAYFRHHHALWYYLKNFQCSASESSLIPITHKKSQEFVMSSWYCTLRLRGFIGLFDMSQTSGCIFLCILHLCFDLINPFLLTVHQMS